MRYTTWGSVRGGCGHVHRSARAAYRCLERDRAGCHRQGGYSDRRIRVVEGGDAEMRAEIDRYHQDGPGRKLYLDDLDYEVIREMPVLENEAAV